MDKIATRILSGLERIQSQTFQGKDLVFLNMNAKDITDIPIPTIPSLIYFKNGDPEVYPGTKRKTKFATDRILYVRSKVGGVIYYNFYQRMSQCSKSTQKLSTIYTMVDRIQHGY